MKFEIFPFRDIRYTLCFASPSIPFVRNRWTTCFCDWLTTHRPWNCWSRSTSTLTSMTFWCISFYRVVLATCGLFFPWIAGLSQSLWLHLYFQNILFNLNETKTFFLNSSYFTNLILVTWKWMLSLQTLIQNWKENLAMTYYFPWLLRWFSSKLRQISQCKSFDQIKVVRSEILSHYFCWNKRITASEKKFYAIASFLL